MWTFFQESYYLIFLMIVMFDIDIIIYFKHKIPICVTFSNPNATMCIVFEQRNILVLILKADEPYYALLLDNVMHIV